MNTQTQILDKEKETAIKHTDGPLLIIAGPGSGKTTTLVERVILLVTEKRVSPEKIMVATFTEKAAKELITRISNRLLDLNLKVNLNEMYIGTLHSIFLRFLEENREFTRLKRNYRLLDDFDQKYFLYRKLNEYLKIDGSELLLGEIKSNRWEKAKSLVTYLGKISEECLDVEQLCKSDDAGIRALGEFKKIYDVHLAEENALDFSTIQSETLHLLQSQPKILSSLQSALSYLMIDEYQDTNTIQEKILLLLAAGHSNICVVGDDDQGLYRFRGATIRNILEFPDNFPKGKCKKVTLTTNYRSTPEIIDFYNRWMAQCDWTDGPKTFRFDKTIKPSDGAISNPSSVIKVSTNADTESYYKEIYNFIVDLEKRKVLSNYNQIAFLFRSVKSEKVIGLASYLEARGINVFSPRSALFFQREEVQLLMGAFIFIFPTLFEDLKWNESAKMDIWDTYLFWKTKFADEIRKDPERHKGLLQWCQKRSKEHLTLTSNTTYGFAALLYQLLEYPMFADNLNSELTANKTDLRSAYNIGMLSKLLFKFEYLHNISVLTPQNIQKSLQNLFNTYFRFIIEGGIEEYEDFDEHAPNNCVSFMTIHQSKGLEFPVVIVDSLGTVPVKQFDDTDVILQNQYYIKPPFEPIEKNKYYDFYRLYYTAFSRAQNLLVLSCNEVEGKGKTPSKYFEPVYKSLSQWTEPQVDLDQLKLAEIKASNIKHEYSFTSHILLYEDCPLQYKFYKELEFTEVRTGGVLGGSLLHQTIEDIHKAVLRDERETLNDSNITEWFNSNYFLLSKQQRSYLHTGQIGALLKQVLRYRDKNANQWDRIKEAEVDVSLVKENYILKGTIDLIKGENDTVELIDFKSGDKPDVNSSEPKTQRQLKQYRRQLEVYAHLVEQRTGSKVSKMHLYYPKVEDGSPYVTFNSNKDNITSTIKSFDDVVTKIENKNFDMGHIIKSEKQCGDCDMRFHCNPKQYFK
ncbi:MAG: ATP-dependent DNA helicase [Bacteroidota bacterium]